MKLSKEDQALFDLASQYDNDYEEEDTPKKSKSSSSGTSDVPIHIEIFEDDNIFAIVLKESINSAGEAGLTRADIFEKVKELKDSGDELFQDKKENKKTDTNTGYNMINRLENKGQLSLSSIFKWAKILNKTIYFKIVGPKNKKLPIKGEGQKIQFKMNENDNVFDVQFKKTINDLNLYKNQLEYLLTEYLFEEISIQDAEAERNRKSSSSKKKKMTEEDYKLYIEKKAAAKAYNLFYSYAKRNELTYKKILLFCELFDMEVQFALMDKKK